MKELDHNQFHGNETGNENVEMSFEISVAA